MYVCDISDFSHASLSNKLLLNPSKTEFLLIGTKQQRLKSQFLA